MKVPKGMQEVINLLIRKDWVTSIFDIETEQLYNPANYLINSNSYNTEYILHIDTNIFDYIIEAYRRNDIIEQRYAIALCVFCQFSEIKIETRLPIFERVKFNNDLLTKTLLELDLFFRIDDTSNPKSLIDFALGKRNDFIINQEKDVSPKIKKISDWYDKYSSLEEWESTYLIILKLTELNLLDCSNSEKFKLFMDWQYKDFRFSMIGIFYGIIMFSFSRKSGMMKYKLNSDAEKRKEQLNNMTWDLYFLIKFYRELKNKKPNQELLLASNDKVLNHIIRAVISVNQSSDINRVKEYLLPKDYCLLDIYKDAINRNSERSYQNKNWSYEYIKSMIDSYEDKLLK